mmetsp:Transcript_24472/g.61547  ORF Transcript_24472/g.61547 Transcript_24472/m.61547 type:complete len:299 (-) Transcript_24472:60-956(-)|eukprot:g14748.t1
MDRLEPLDAVGGHAAAGKGALMLRDAASGRLLKPYQERTDEQRAEGRTRSRGQIECDFYVAAHGSGHPLTEFLCQFYGIVVDTDAEQSSQSGKRKDQDGGGGCRYLSLEDVTAGFELPCVMDVKIGKKTYDEQAGPDKVLSQTSSYPLQERIGFRLSGLSSYAPADGRSDCLCSPGVGARVKRDHKWGKSLDAESVLDGFRLFFTESLLRDAPGLVRAVEERLKRLRAIILEKPKWRIYASSVLVAYDRSRPADTLRVTLIDFAHVYEIQEADKGTELEKDYNFLFGLDSLLDYMRKI